MAAKKNILAKVKKMKIVSSLVLIAALAAVGCTSTLSVGSQVNSDGKIVDGSISKENVSVTLPLVSAGVGFADEKKK